MIDNDTIRKMETFYLKKLHFYTEQRISLDFLHTLKFDGIISDISDSLALAAVKEFISFIEKDDIASLKISYPKNWWQHFKQTFFPKWLLKKYPVKYETVTKTWTYDVEWIFPFSPSITKEFGPAVRRVNIQKSL